MRDEKESCRIEEKILELVSFYWRVLSIVNLPVFNYEYLQASRSMCAEALGSRRQFSGSSLDKP